MNEASGGIMKAKAIVDKVDIAPLFDRLHDVSFPEWLVDGATRLVAAAEDLMPGENRGKARKEWVREALLKLAAEHDIKKVPDWLETLAEKIVVNLLIELVFAVHVAPGQRRKQRIGAQLSLGIDRG